jgi:hypothetical protein
MTRHYSCPTKTLYKLINEKNGEIEKDKNNRRNDNQNN